MLGPGITSRAAVLASHTQVLENADETYLYSMLLVQIASCTAVPASRTQVLDEDDETYVY
jgi:hypothetical protein